MCVVMEIRYRVLLGGRLVIHKLSQVRLLWRVLSSSGLGLVSVWWILIDYMYQYYQCLQR